MTVLAINSDEPFCAARLTRAVSGLSHSAPIVIMVHGFRYCPRSNHTNPHAQILSLAPTSNHWKIVSWPQRLQLTGENGLAVGFGWSARGTIWQAYQAAAGAGARLADFIALLHQVAPNRPIHLIAHSLGARVALHGLQQTGPNTVGRAILISPAVFTREAATLPRTADVFSMISRENTAYDLMLRAALPHQGVTLGRGGPDLPNWLDIRLHCHGTLSTLHGLGHKIAAPDRRVCHWSGYLRPGVWDFYRTLLTRPGELPLPYLRGALAGVSPAQPRLPALPFRAGMT